MKFQKLSVALGYYMALLNGQRCFSFSDKKYCDLVHALALSVGYLGDCFPAQRKLSAFLIDKINNKVNVGESNEAFAKFVKEVRMSREENEDEGFVPTIICGALTTYQFNYSFDTAEDFRRTYGYSEPKNEDAAILLLFGSSEGMRLANELDNFVKDSAQLKDVLAELNKWYPILVNERSSQS